MIVTCYDNILLEYKMNLPVLDILINWNYSCFCLLIWLKKEKNLLSFSNSSNACFCTKRLDAELVRNYIPYHNRTGYVHHVPKLGKTYGSTEKTKHTQWEFKMYPNYFQNVFYKTILYLKSQPAYFTAKRK